jgi:hypothetical protein
MHDTRFTAQSFAEKREPCDSVLEFSAGSLTKGLEELADSIKKRETIIKEVSSNEKVSVGDKEFACASVTFTYYLGNFESLKNAETESNP